MKTKIERTLKRFEDELLTFCDANWIEVTIKPIANIDNIKLSAMKHHLPRNDKGCAFELIIFTNEFPDRVYLLCREVGRFLGYTLDDFNNSKETADKWGLSILERFFDENKIQKDIAEEIKNAIVEYLKK